MYTIFNFMPKPENKSLVKSLREIPISPRGLNYYLPHFKIEETYFDNPNEVIIDMGSGLKQNLAREVESRGLRAKVISVDPSLLDGEHLEDNERKVSGSFHANTVAAFAERLPFSSNSIDKILVHSSIPYYSISEEIFLVELKEMIRVLKPGGEIKIYPYPAFSNAQKFNYSAINEKMMKNMEIETVLDRYLLIIKKK